MDESSTFSFNSLIKESKDVLVSPKSYFASMKTTGGLGEPVIKALVYGAVAGIISFIWSLLHLGGGMYGHGFGIMIIIWAIIYALIGLFVGAVVIMVVSAICKGSTDFEACARVTAACMVIMPVTAILGFFYGLVGFRIGTIVSLIVSLYGLYILYHGIVEALKANAGTARIVIYVLVALLALSMLLGMRTSRRIDRDFKNMMEDVQKK